ncbi:T-cell surface glycoprotein CD3 delta chain-like [Morone saxatilis]|uniref:T-cell surface glycoprotein CD3 delta chain-like n=1 Tax=Morone saxatilis TaxID=34816 RepID=UPI0015E1D425|nr:T-cell surface glycoprotein CD3 delta chain-like [Morone saxatilis]XP_035536406.1 T-cell surface glycoprotein CD3 delta chain-like [Morone saxatilis]
MKSQTILPACLLLLLTLTALVRCKDDAAKDSTTKITVKTVSEGIELSCVAGNKITLLKTLQYRDDHTGEYKCETDPSGDETNTNTDSQTELTKIYVKFRSCDNCIELDEVSIAGIAVGNVIATIVIGVAVYLIASQTRITPNTTHKKSSDRQPIVPNQQAPSSGPNDSHYQPLAKGRKDVYDKLHKK